ncbi:MAG: DUF6090 family protein [Robiginitalea sp.]|jgi:hypothetical protein
MLRFLRRPRQDLLTENPPNQDSQAGRFSKYILYAIGEILLVVFGILIALQVDNWNDYRKEREVETGILQDLQIEFDENLTDARRVYDGNKSIYNAAIELQDNIASKTYEQNRTDTLMYAMFDWFDYTPKPGASNNLINSGNLSLIRNEELRNLLTLWSGVNAELDDDEQLAIAYSQQTILPFIAEHYPMSNLERFDNLDAFYSMRGFTDSLIVASPEVRLFDVEGLLTNPVFQSHISAKKMYARHNMVECQYVIYTCRSILEIIDLELTSR